MNLGTDRAMVLCYLRVCAISTATNMLVRPGGDPLAAPLGPDRGGTG